LFDESKTNRNRAVGISYRDCRNNDFGFSHQGFGHLMESFWLAPREKSFELDCPLERQIKFMKMPRHNYMKLCLHLLPLASAILLTGCVSNHPTVGTWCGSGFSPVRTDKIALTLRPNPNDEDAELGRVLSAELKREGFNLVPLAEADYTLAYLVEDDSVDNYVPVPQFTISIPPQTTEQIADPRVRPPTDMAPPGFQQPAISELVVYHNKGIRLYLYTNPKTQPGGLQVAWSGCIEVGEKVSVEREPLLIQALLGHFGQEYSGRADLVKQNP